MHLSLHHNPMQFHRDQQRPESRAYEVVYVNRLSLKYHNARVQTGQFKQRRDQPVHAHQQFLCFPNKGPPFVFIRIFLQQGKR